jgi:large subunit ribosomal protein L17
MRKRNSVKQLGRTYSHRKALYGNMVTSLIRHERIVTTREKAKEVQRVAEKLITRARKNLDAPDDSTRLHNKREAKKVLKDREALVKLFDVIAPRFRERPGGYTRILLLGDRRAGDAAEMAILELVEKGDAGKLVKTEEKPEKAEKKPAKETKDSKKEKEPKIKETKDSKKEKEPKSKESKDSKKEKESKSKESKKE